LNHSSPISGGWDLFTEWYLDPYKELLYCAFIWFKTLDVFYFVLAFSTKSFCWVDLNCPLNDGEGLGRSLGSGYLSSSAAGFDNNATLVLKV